MATRRGFYGITAVFALVLGAAPAAWAQQSVHPYKLKGTAIVGEMIGGELVILKEKFSSDVVVQLARGRSLDARPPASEILAAVVDCGTSQTPFVTQIVVWDTEQETILVEVSAPISPDDSALRSKGGAMNVVEAQFVADVTLNATGQAGVNAIDGGEWKAAGVAKIDTRSPDGCPKSVKMSLIGTLNVTVSDGPFALALETLVPKASATASKAIAFLQ